MPTDHPSPNMRIQLSDERRAEILAALRRLHIDDFDQPISDYQAQRILDLFLKHLGPPVYNQAIQDARAFMLDKLDDIEGEVFEPNPQT